MADMACATGVTLVETEWLFGKSKMLWLSVSLTSILGPIQPLPTNQDQYTAFIQAN